MVNRTNAQAVMSVLEEIESRCIVSAHLTLEPPPDFTGKWLMPQMVLRINRILEHDPCGNGQLLLGFLCQAFKSPQEMAELFGGTIAKALAGRKLLFVRTDGEFSAYYCRPMAIDRYGASFRTNSHGVGQFFAVRLETLNCQKPVRPFANRSLALIGYEMFLTLGLNSMSSEEVTYYYEDTPPYSFT